MQRCIAHDPLVQLLRVYTTILRPKPQRLHIATEVTTLNTMPSYPNPSPRRRRRANSAPDDTADNITRRMIHHAKLTDPGSFRREFLSRKLNTLVDCTRGFYPCETQTEADERESVRDVTPGSGADTRVTTANNSLTDSEGGSTGSDAVDQVEIPREKSQLLKSFWITENHKGMSNREKFLNDIPAMFRMKDTDGGLIGSGKNEMVLIDSGVKVCY